MMCGAETEQRRGSWPAGEGGRWVTASVVKAERLMGWSMFASGIGSVPRCCVHLWPEFSFKASWRVSLERRPP